MRERVLVFNDRSNAVVGEVVKLLTDFGIEVTHGNSHSKIAAGERGPRAVVICEPTGSKRCRRMIRAAGGRPVVLLSDGIDFGDYYGLMTNNEVQYYFECKESPHRIADAIRWAIRA